MDTNWAKNLAGVRLSEKDMATISYPKQELYIHVTTKTVQAGGIMGSLIIAPTLTAIQGPRDMNALKARMESCGKYGILVGLVAGPLMTWSRLAQSDVTPVSIWDRCYRIRYSKNQVRVDRLSLIGAVAGCAAARFLNESGTLGAIVGMGSGCIFAAVLNQMM